MPAIPWSQQARLSAAVDALNEWTAVAEAHDIRVPSLTVELLSEDGSEVVAAVVFERIPDSSPPEYAYRTI